MICNSIKNPGLANIIVSFLSLSRQSLIKVATMLVEVRDL